MLYTNFGITARELINIPLNGRLSCLLPGVSFCTQYQFDTRRVKLQEIIKKKLCFVKKQGYWLSGRGTQRHTLS